MRVRDIMTSPVAVLHAHETARDAAVAFYRTGYAEMPVVGDDGRMVGIVSESDVLRASTTQQPGQGTSRPVTDIMTTAMRGVTLDADLFVVAKDVLGRDLRCVPAVQDGRPVGIVCRRNLISALVRDDEVIAARVTALLHAYGGPARRWTVSVRSGVVEVRGQFADEAERRIVTALVHTEAGVTGVELLPPLPLPRTADPAGTTTPP